MSAFDWRKAKATNFDEVVTTFDAKLAATAAPSGDMVHNLAALGLATTANSPQYLNILAYGVGVDTISFEMRVWGWWRYGTTLWIPEVIWYGAWTLRGVLATALGTDNYLNRGHGGIDGPAGIYSDFVTALDADTTLSGLLHIRGAQYLEFAFAFPDAQITEANCLWRLLDRR